MTKKGGFSKKRRKEVKKKMTTNLREETRVKPEELRGLVDYLSEINVLKRTPRGGWRFAGPSVKVEPDDDAGHIAQVAQIAYLLGRMEGLEMEEALKCVGLAVFHENTETRLPDRDKIATHYLKIPEETFLRVIGDQTARLPKEIAREILNFALEANYGNTPEAVIVQDADTLEASIQARIFNERGFIIEENLLRKYLDEERFQTRSAKRLVNALRRRKDFSIGWWQDLVPKLEE